jgi:molybdate transport system regulatory protein
MQPRFNLWIEVEGKVALSGWRVKLLKTIAAAGSINAAAQQMSIPYHTTWQKIHEMEEHLGVKLLETRTGGLHGGGAQLSPAAEDYLNKMDEFYAVLTPLVESTYQRIFKE